MSKLTLASIVAEFGESAKAKLANSAATGQPEDQLRGPLETMFAGLSELCGYAPGTTVLVGETSLADLKTRPDYSVTHGVGKAKALIGFIEVKAPGKGSDPRKFTDPHDKEQWKRLKALPNLIYTDGNGLSVWRNGELQGEVIRFDGDVETSGKALSAPDALTAAITDFLSWEPIAPNGARELAKTSARLCRFLRDEVIEQMDRKNAALLALAEDWRALLFPDASDAQFADGYAQAVTFGMLMAKSLGLSLKDDLDTVGKKLGQSNTLIGTALRLLTDDEELLKISLTTMQRVLDVVNWDKVSKGDPEAWLYFYERFLETYDNTLRKKTGSYYTPPQVVEAMVRLCDEALKSPGRYNIGKGLAADEVHIADPAMGSGTYLLAIVRHIAKTFEADLGEGAVLAAMNKAVTRLYGFELQFGAFAVAQLRLLAEMIEIAKRSLGDDVEIDDSALITPHMFVTDTLGDPYADFETGQGIYKEISKSRAEANKVKREEKITVVIGNPPYKNEAMGKGSWVEKGSVARPEPIFADWVPPKDWKLGAHAKHLRNLYIYFWRWAAWKVFEQGKGNRDLEPPIPENYAGIVCYITVSGFLNGPAFEKMRADLRRDCDEIWVIDCSPEGHQPEVASRIFQGVQQPVCIVIASRSSANDPKVPARVLYRALIKGRRDSKFEELAKLKLASKGWAQGPSNWRAPFLPDLAGGWADFVPLDSLFGYTGPGVKAGRTWVIAPDDSSLEARWLHLIDEPSAEQRGELFENKTGDRHISKSAKALDGLHADDRRSIDSLLENLKSESSEPEARRLLSPPAGVKLAFRSFDRQKILSDSRVIDRPRPNLWKAWSEKQAFFTAPMDLAPSNGPALTITGLVPDQHHYANRGGHVFSLWQNAAATISNVTDAAMTAMTKTYGFAPAAEDVFAYVAALLAHPAYTARFKADLVRPGLRVPLTADKELFKKAAKLGREIVWLHTFGERFADPAATPPRPASEPRLPVGERPTIPKGGAIPDDPAGFPDTLDYDAAKRQLKVGMGRIDNVPTEVWAYEVSGKNVLTQWFSYRKKNRERPIIGDRRKPSPLGDIQPDHWLPEYTEELLNVLNVLGLLVRKEAEQAKLLDEIVDGPLIPASKVEKAGP